MFKKKFRFFSAMLGHPEGRGRATPIVGKKLKIGIFLNSFTIEKLMINQNFSEFFSNFG